MRKRTQLCAFAILVVLATMAPGVMAKPDGVGVCHEGEAAGHFSYVVVPAKQLELNKAGKYHGHGRHVQEGHDILGLTREQCLARNPVKPTPSPSPVAFVNAAPITCPSGQSPVHTDVGWFCGNNGGNTSNADETKNPNT